MSQALFRTASLRSAHKSFTNSEIACFGRSSVAQKVAGRTDTSTGQWRGVWPSQHTLLKAALPHRPDRIILGEVRGPEARTLLDAMNTGHDGTLTTIHASSTNGALRRLASLAVRASDQMTMRNAQEEVRASIGLVIQLARLNGHRAICDILELG